MNTQLQLENIISSPLFSEEVKTITTPSSCTICGQGCPLKIETLNGKIISKVLHNTHPRFSKYYAACGRPRIIAEVWNHPDRIRQPMIRDGPRGSGVFKKVSWEEALDYVAENLRRYLDKPEQIIFFSHQGNESLIFDEFGRMIGTPNITDHADTCFHGSAAGRWFLFGRFVGPGAIFPDYENAQFIVFMGRNPYGGIVAAPWTKMMSVGMESQKRIVVFDVRYSEICEVAERYYIVKPGTDLAISLAMMNEILVKKLYDAEYLRKYTNAAMLFYTESKKPVELQILEDGPRAGKKDYLVYDDEDKVFIMKSKCKKPKIEFMGRYHGQPVATALKLLESSVKQYTPEWAEKISGVGAEEIRWVAQMLAQYSPRSFIDPGYKSVRYLNEPMLHRVNALINILIGSWGSRGGIAWARRAAIPTPRPDGELKYEAAAKC
ncbi:MAG: molybdopterin-dependent oxidoreductase [Nitrososphaeria archaeon]|nr:molybdopterin-dependent oxidoreductase [Nitrososphaeria archaeon]